MYDLMLCEYVEGFFITDEFLVWEQPKEYRLLVYQLRTGERIRNTYQLYQNLTDAIAPANTRLECVGGVIGRSLFYVAAVLVGGSFVSRPSVDELKRTSFFPIFLFNALEFITVSLLVLIPSSLSMSTEFLKVRVPAAECAKSSSF